MKFKNLSLLIISWFLAACTAARPTIKPWHESQADTQRSWRAQMFDALPEEVKQRVNAANAATEPDQDENLRLQAIARHFNANGGGDWELRTLTDVEDDNTPMRCKCKCSYMLLSRKADPINRWQVTLGCSQGSRISFDPWRFMPAGYREIKPGDTFDVKFDLGLTLREMLALAELDNVTVFPWGVRGTVDEIQFPMIDGYRNVTFQIIKFDQPMTSEGVSYELAKRGLQPALLGEILSFAEASKGMFAKGPIVTIGWHYAIKTYSGRETIYFASLSLDEWRSFSFSEKEPEKWDSNTYFLAVKK